MQVAKRELQVRGWGTRLSFAAVLLVCSEWIVWQRPTTYSLPEWLGIGIVYVALAAATLDLIARLRVRDLARLLLLAGLYGLTNGTLIAHITARDLPVSLLGRPLGAQPLAFLLALALFQVLSSGRATGPLDFIAALATGALWGIWVRWFPVVSDERVPAATSDEAILALAVLLMGCAALHYALPAGDPAPHRAWLLRRGEALLVSAVLGATLLFGLAQGALREADIAILAGLGSFLAIVLLLSAPIDERPSLLRHMTPPRRPNLAAWLLVVVPFLIAGWAGYHLPGEGTSSPQSNLLFGGLTLFGLLWPPVIAGLIGARVLARLTREGW